MLFMHNWVFGWILKYGSWKDFDKYWRIIRRKILIYSKPLKFCFLYPLTIQCKLARTARFFHVFNHAEAINSEVLEYWVSAMQKEFDSLLENNTFELKKVSKDKNIVGSKWVYTLKYKDDGSYEYKVQFVAKGYLQIYGKDYQKTFA